MNNKTKQVWIAWINSDLTEGRGYEIPYCVCETKATAIRRGKSKNVQGSDAYVRPFTAVYLDGYWLAPCNIIPPTREDEMENMRIANKEAALAKARLAGLTDEDIAAILKI